MIGTFPSCQSLSRNVHIFDGAADINSLGTIYLHVAHSGQPRARPVAFF
jgi:hypothetical protein